MKNDYEINQNELVETIFNVLLVNESGRVVGIKNFDLYPSPYQIAELLIDNKEAFMVKVDKYTVLKEGKELEKFKEALLNPNTINMKLY